MVVYLINYLHYFRRFLYIFAYCYSKEQSKGQTSYRIRETTLIVKNAANVNPGNCRLFGSIQRLSYRFLCY